MDFIKENREIWFYIIGIIILFIIFFIGANVFLNDNIITGDDDEPTVDSNVPNAYDSPPSFTLDTDEDYYAVVTTNFGEVTVDLYEANAPVNVNNFVFLSTQGYYDGLSAYRLIPNLLVQSGSRVVLNENVADDEFGNPGYTVIDEINWDSLDFDEEKREELGLEGFSSNANVVSKPIKKYTLVMANAGKSASAGSQYFFVIGDDADPRVNYLNGRHTAIGEVIEGRDVLDRFRDIDSQEIEGSTVPRPNEEIVIERVDIKIRD